MKMFTRGCNTNLAGLVELIITFVSYTMNLVFTLWINLQHINFNAYLIKNANHKGNDRKRTAVKANSRM